MATEGGRLTAVVVGGGIGGLAAAVALRQGGWGVLVLERAAEFREVGAGLTLAGNAVRALSALGLADRVRHGAHLDGPSGFRAADGRWLWRVDVSQLAEGLGTDTLAIHRARLLAVLRDGLPVESLRAATEVVEVRPGSAEGLAEVRYACAGHHRSVRAGLVVAADGIFSRTRSYLWPTAPGPVYVGSTAWRAVTTQPWVGQLAPAITWGPGAEFGICPLGDRSVYWYGAVKSLPGRRSTDELAEARRLFGAWHRPIPDLLDAAEPSTVLRHDLFRLAGPLPSFVKGRVALLGDAAHAMAPYLGQGAALALEDAVVLGAYCRDTTDVTRALGRYDADRRPRTQQVARASDRVGRIGQQLSNRFAVAGRNALLRVLPPQLLLDQMTALGRWTPPDAA